MSWPSIETRKLADWAGAALVLGGILWVHTSIIFARLEWADWVAYALPAANLIERGVLATPQLGTQLGLDRFWLWNSPWMGAGPFLMYLLGGVGRESYLAGLVLQNLLLVGAFLVLSRRLLDLRSWTVAALVVLTLVGTRTYLGELYNQRYSVLGILGLALLFLPTSGGRSGAATWQWLLAGAMPLIHPALVFCSAFWALIEAARWAWTRRRDPAVPLPTRGLAVFALGVLGCAVWYLRDEPLRLQFLPQARALTHMSGFMVPASWLAAVPTYATYAVLIAAAVAALGWADGARPEGVSARLAALLLLVMIAHDQLAGSKYLAFYLLGLALPILAAFARGPLRAPMLGALVLLALGHAAISARLDRSPPIWTRPAEVEAFVLQHTRPGDRIVLGPPFVLLAAEPSLPDGRRVAYVVPQPYMVDGHFDHGRFREAIRRGTDVYVGEPRFFHTVEGSKSFKSDWRSDPTLRPLYPGAAVRSATFEGQEVCVARAPAEDQGHASRPAPAATAAAPRPQGGGG